MTGFISEREKREKEPGAVMWVVNSTNPMIYPPHYERQTAVVCLAATADGALAVAKSECPDLTFEEPIRSGGHW